VAVAVVDVQVNGSNAVNQLRQISRASQATEAGIKSLKGAVTGLVGAFSAVQALKFVVAKTSELETQTRSLQTLTGSVEKAKQIISELQQIGAVTPFTSTELIESAKRLQAFGVEADKVVETTRRLADVSGATGAELQGLVTAYGQVQAKGRLQGEELLQFQERGIALQTELRRMYGLTGEEFQKALSKGQISAEAVQVAIVNLTNAGGKYANGAIAQSTTLAGKFSTLQDNIEQIARVLGQKLQPILSSILDTANRTVGAISQVLSGGLAAEFAKLRVALVTPGGTVGDLQKILELTKSISASGLDKGGLTAAADQIKANQQLVADVLTRINQTRPLGATKEEQKLALAIQGASQQKIKELDIAYKALSKVTAAPPANVPQLLGGNGKDKGRAKSVDELLGGQIKRTLELKKAQLETVTAARMNTAALQGNAEQAKRMVEYASKYQGIQLEISSLEETLAGLNAVKPQILASAADKQAAAMMIDERTLDLQNAIAAKRQEISTLATQHVGEVNQVAIAESKKLESLTEQTKYLQDVLKYGESEANIKRQIESVMKSTSTLDREKTEAIIRQNQGLQQQITDAQRLDQIYSGLGQTIATGVTDMIGAAVDKTKSLADVASNMLRNLANQLLQVAVNTALFSLFPGSSLFKGLPRFADGGSISGGKPAIVGERGPELFMPGRSGSIVPNNALGGANIVVNVDASGSSVQGDANDSKRLGEAIGVAVRQELIKQKRPGGLLA